MRMTNRAYAKILKMTSCTSFTLENMDHESFGSCMREILSRTWVVPLFPQLMYSALSDSLNPVVAREAAYEWCNCYCSMSIVNYHGQKYPLLAHALLKASTVKKSYLATTHKYIEYTNFCPIIHIVIIPLSTLSFMFPEKTRTEYDNMLTLLKHPL